MRIFLAVFLIVMAGCGVGYAGSGFSWPAWPPLKAQKPVVPSTSPSTPEKKKTVLPFEKGEQLKFQVNYKGLPMGTSTLTFLGTVEMQGKQVYRITFNTAMPLVKDREVLYAEMDSFLPIRVERDISRAGAFPLKITETYDQSHGKISIEKKGNIARSTMSIQKSGAVHNAILLNYFYRSLPDLEKQGEYSVTLPTLDFKVVYKGKEYVKTALGEFHAYVFNSVPAKFKLWVSADKRRIPLKIENPGTLGYSLEIKSVEYIPQEKLPE